MKRRPAVARRVRVLPGGRQRGLSLITALLFMVAALVLGVSVMSVNVMQERMIGNAKDRDLAMQAAEAALRDAERDLSLHAATLVFKEDCSDGLCVPPSQRSVPSPLPIHAGFAWAATKVRTYGAYTSAPAYFQRDSSSQWVARQPIYVIEKLGNLGVGVGESMLGAPGSRGTAYRITARGFGAREDTVVMLQSIYTVR